MNKMVEVSDGSLCTTQKFVFFIGPRKTGTSWINAYLEKRDDVITPQTTKETFFFDRYFERGTAWYEAQFPAEPDPTCVVAECAPSYAANPEAIQRICETIPNAVFVITLRDPVARVQSHWRHLIRYGHKGENPLEAMAPGEELLSDSLYADILETVVSQAGADRVHVILYEDLRKDPVEFARAVCHAMGIPEMAPDTTSMARQVNAAQKPRSLLLSSMASKSAEMLRNAGLHRIVRTARKAGLRNVLERPYDASETGLDEQTKSAVRAKLAKQMLETAQQVQQTPALAPLEKADALARDLSEWAKDR